MNRYAALPVLAIVAAFAGCTTYGPDAGHEVVLIKKPWFFGHGGVVDEPVQTGRTFTAITTRGIDVNMQPAKFETTMDDTMTSDGVPVTFHAISVLQVTDSVQLIKNFGPNWYTNNVEEPFKTMVRQAVRKRGMNETAISTTALDAIDAEIKADLAAFLVDKALPIHPTPSSTSASKPRRRNSASRPRSR
jgi:regulator of protease activity HflC (stomatin/prohibitin superfamily)